MKKVVFLVQYYMESYTDKNSRQSLYCRVKSNEVFDNEVLL